MNYLKPKGGFKVRLKYLFNFSKVKEDELHVCDDCNCEITANEIHYESEDILVRTPDTVVYTTYLCLECAKKRR